MVKNLITIFTMFYKIHMFSLLIKAWSLISQKVRFCKISWKHSKIKQNCSSYVILKPNLNFYLSYSFSFFKIVLWVYFNNTEFVAVRSQSPKWTLFFAVAVKCFSLMINLAPFRSQRDVCDNFCTFFITKFTIVDVPKARLPFLFIFF